MESLYRKYRPKTFDEVVGQQHVVETLKHAVLEGRTSHAYLFCGPRGTGKTTMARILAKALECEQGPGHLPDGTCEQCQLIAEGEHPDVYELDAASRTGVDNVREEIINRVSFAPVRGAYKVYIIDEVHMLTTAAFNALLKTLEEPPDHVVFILCTTDPQKIPATILSRVQRFDFHAIGNDLIQAHLEWVCQQEGFQFDPAAIELIVRHARGGMRDALSELEQLSVFGEKDISLEAAQNMLGEVAGSTLEKVSRALAERDVPTAFGEVGSLVEAGRDLLQFARELAGHLRDVYVVAAVGAREGVVDAQGDELERLKNEAALFGSPDRVSYALCVLSDASNQMRTAVNQRLALEVALTRICRPKTDLTLESLADRVASLEAEVAALSAPGARAAAPATAPAAGEGPAAQVVPAQQSAAEKFQAAEQPAPAAARPQAPARLVAQPARAESPAAPQPQAPARAAQPARPVQPAVQAPAQRPAAPQPEAAVRPSAVPAPQAPAVPRPASASQAPAAPAAQAAPSAPAAGAVTDPGELQRRWKQVVETLKTTNPARGSLLMSTTIVSDDGSKLTVSLPKGSTFAVKMLDRQDVRAIIDPVVAQVFGHRVVSYVESGAPSAAGSQAQGAAPRSAASPRPSAAPHPSHTARPAAPAPQPQPAPRPAAPTPSQVPAPAAPAPAAARPAAQQPASAYPMPWDAGMPPADDDPYAEDAAPLGDIPPAAKAPSATAAPAPATAAPQAAAPAQSPATAQHAPAPAPAPQSAAAAQPAMAPRAPQPTAPQPTAPGPTPKPKPASAQAPAAPKRPRRMKGEPLPAEAQKVYDMLTEVFGECQLIDVEPAQDSQAPSPDDGQGGES